MDDIEKMKAGSATFVVQDKSLAWDHSSKIYDWLKQEGFKMWKYSKGKYGTLDWIFINVNSKVYANGMPGVQISEPVGKCKISWEEFLTIYEILKIKHN